MKISSYALTAALYCGYGQDEDLAVPSLASSEAVWKSASTINEVVKLTLAISVVREVCTYSSS